MKKMLLQFADSVLSAKEMNMVMGKDSCTTVCKNGETRSVQCEGTCTADAYAAFCNDWSAVDICPY